MISRRTFCTMAGATALSACLPQASRAASSVTEVDILGNRSLSRVPEQMGVRRIALETETTGLGVGHRSIEIGGVEIVGRQITGRSFHCYIHPERAICPGAKTVHGLTEEFLADKPLFGSIAAELIAFISNAELIVHSAKFHVRYLNYELRLLNHPPLQKITAAIVDTVSLARELRPGRKNSFDAIFADYGLEGPKAELSGAHREAARLAEVYLAMTATR